MRDVRNELGILSETVGGLGRLGRTMTFAVTAPLLALGGAAVKSAMDFEGAMKNINSIAQLPAQALAELSARTLEFGSTIRSGPQAAAEALYQVFSAGILDTDKAFQIMSVSTKVAEAGLADLSATTKAITATMQAYNFEQQEAGKVGDVWTRMVALGVGSLEDFLANSQKVLPLSSALGISFEDLGASVAFLSQQGGGAKKAMTALAMMESNLLKPTTTLQAAYAELGVTTGPQLIAKFGNINAAIAALRGTMTDAQFFKSFSKTGLEAALAITNNFDRATQATEDFMSGLTGATASAWEQQMSSFAAQVDLLKSAALGLGITIGNILLPVLTPLVQGFTGLLTSAQKLDPNLLKIATAFGVVLAAAGPVLWIVSSLVSPFGLLLAASAALATAIATDWGGIKTGIENAVNTALPAVKELMGIVDQFFGILFADEQVIMPGIFDTTIDASSIAVEIKGSIWDSWTGDLKEQFPDRAQFIELATQALQEQHGLTPYEIPVEGVSISLGGAFAGGGDDLYAQAMGFNRDPQDITTPFAERLSIAIANARPQVETALSNLFAQVKTFIVDTVFPTFDTIGSDLLFRIGDSINTTISIGKEGKSPLFDAIRGLFNTGISGALSTVQSLIAKHFPQVSEGFSWLITNIGSWLVNEGIPAFSRSLGYFIGRIGGLIGQGIAAIPQLLTGMGGEGGLGTALEKFGNTVSEPFSAGFSDAMADLQITNPGDQLVTSIAGWIGLLLATKLAAALIMQGVGATVGSILTSVIGSASLGGAVAGGAAKSAGGGLAFSIGKFIGGAFSAATSTIGLAAGAALTAALVVGYLFDENLRNQVNLIGEEIADTLFGKGWTDTARQNIQTSLTPILEPLMRPFAEWQANLQASAQGDFINRIGEEGQGGLPSLVSIPSFAKGTIPRHAMEDWIIQVEEFRSNALKAEDLLPTQEEVTTATIPLQTAVAPESPLQVGLLGLASTGITAFQDMKDGTKTNTDIMANILAGFAATGFNALLAKIQEVQTALAAALGAYAGLTALAGNPIPISATAGADLPYGGPTPPNSSNTVVINGVQDVEGMKRELRRQGIDLEEMARR